MSSTGPAADAARADFRALMEAKGHAVDNARAAVDRLEAAFAAGDLVRTPTLDLELGDLMRALEQDEGQKLGGKSAEAARFILKAIDRELDQRLSRSTRHTKTRPPTRGSRPRVLTSSALSDGRRVLASRRGEDRVEDRVLGLLDRRYA